jgi:hypothetical protein
VLPCRVCVHHGTCVVPPVLDLLGGVTCYCYKLQKLFFNFICVCVYTGCVYSVHGYYCISYIASYLPIFKHSALARHYLSSLSLLDQPFRYLWFVMFDSFFSQPTIKTKISQYNPNQCSIAGGNHAIVPCNDILHTGR